MLHLICKSRSQSLEEERRDTESMLLEVQCEVSTVSDGLGCHVICWCGPLCFLKSTVNADIYQHFMLPSADKLYGDADYIFQQDLAPAHTAKGTKSWLNTMVLLYMHELWWSVHLWITERLTLVYWLDWLFLPPLWPQSSLHDTGVILLVSPTRVTLSMTSICSVEIGSPDASSQCCVLYVCGATVIPPLSLQSSAPASVQALMSCSFAAERNLAKLHLIMQCSNTTNV